MTQVNIPILYSFRRCPYAMRARMAILLNNITVELREVVLRDKPPSLLCYSPKGTVPVLVDNGSVVDESREIIDWSIAESKAPVISPATEQQQRLIDHNDNVFKSHLDKYKYFDRHPQYPQSHYREQGEQFLAQLEEKLSNQPYLFGQHISYADIAIFPFIRQFAGVENGWLAASRYRQVKRWLDGFLQSEAFKQTMKKFAKWQENDEAIFFPSITEK